MVFDVGGRARMILEALKKKNDCLLKRTKIWKRLPNRYSAVQYSITDGKSSESVQLAMLKACDACADMGQ